MILKRKRLILAGLALLVAVGIMLIPVKALTVSKGEELIYAFYLKTDDFSVQWDHSVEKEAWVEYFKIKADDLYLASTKFKTFGAGVPSQSEDPAVIKNGWVHMDVERKIGSELVVRSNDINEYQLHYNENDYALKPSDTAYSIEVKNARLPIIISTWLRRIVR